MVDKDKEFAEAEQTGLPEFLRDKPSTDFDRRMRVRKSDRVRRCAESYVDNFIATIEDVPYNGPEMKAHSFMGEMMEAQGFRIALKERNWIELYKVSEWQDFVNTVSGKTVSFEQHPVWEFLTIATL